MRTAKICREACNEALATMQTAQAYSPTSSAGNRIRHIQTKLRELAKLLEQIEEQEGEL